MNSPEADARILIIGYGNTLRGDDGLGPVAAERLSDLLPERLVNVIAAHQLLPELTEPLSRADLAIFIDACCDLPPGELSCKPIEPQADASGSMTHHLNPPTLLALAHRLFGHSPRAYLITVGGASFDLELQLSPTMQASLPQVIDQVNHLIRDYNATAHTDSTSSPPSHPTPSDTPPASPPIPSLRASVPSCLRAFDPPADPTRNAYNAPSTPEEPADA